MTPEQEEQVRRALRATAEGEGPGMPLPPEVGDRLDALLGDLARARAPRATATTTGAGAATATEAGAATPGTRPRPADELAARRRRWPQVLVAAATVAVIALAGGAVATGGFGLAGGTGASSDSAAGGSSADDSAGADEGAAPESGSAGSSRSTGPPTGPRALSSEAGRPYRLRTATLRVDLRRVARQAAAADASRELDGDAADAGAQADCPRPQVGPGQTLVAVLLDGEPGSLVLGRPRRGPGGAREARVYSCSDPDEPVRTTTVR